MAKRIALLHCGHQYHAKVTQLADSLGGEMIVIDLDLLSKLPIDQVSDCDLILYEAFGPGDQFGDALTRIRQASHAPVVILTSSNHSDRTIDALRAGADAVIPLNIAHEVIVAHCSALMRRWRTAGNLLMVEANSAF